MLKAKEIWIDLENNKNDFIIKKMKKENKLFTENDLLELFKLSKKKNLKLPTKIILEKLLEKWNINSLIQQSWIDPSNLSRKEISTDYIYDIVRELNTPSKAKLENENETKQYSVYTKLKRLERTIADDAWKKIILKYLKFKKIILKK